MQKAHCTGPRYARPVLAALTVHMNYIEIEIEEWKNREASALVRVLKRILPAANPDLEALIKKTRFWWLEFDEDGLPQREIGFDQTRKPIVLGPVAENHGFLIDSADDWRSFKKTNSVAAANFESIWSQLWPSFEDLENDR